MLVQFKRERVLIPLPYNSFIEVTKDKHFNEFHFREMFSPTDGAARWTSERFCLERIGIDGVLLGKAKMVVDGIHKAKQSLAALGQGRPQYKALAPIAESTLRHYQADFTFHDALRFLMENPKRFVWAIRNTGTWLFTHHAEWNFAHSALNCQEHTIYLWNDGELTQIDRAKALSAILLSLP